jgi:hypothetical protein
MKKTELLLGILLFILTLPIWLVYFIFLYSVIFFDFVVSILVSLGFIETKIRLGKK